MNLFKKWALGVFSLIIFIGAFVSFVKITQAGDLIVGSAPLVDLTVALAPPQTVATTVTPMIFTTRIKNSGPVGTGVAFNNSWQISDKADYSNIIKTLTTNTSIPLDANSTSVFDERSPAYTFPSAGTYYVRAIADSTNIVDETDGTNNSSSWTTVNVVHLDTRKMILLSTDGTIINIFSKHF